MINILHMLITMSECDIDGISQIEGGSVDNHDQDEIDTRQFMITRMDRTIESANLLSTYSGELKDKQG